MRRVLAVVVKNGEVVSYDTNGHAPCLREGYPTGEGYELCPGCDYQNHAEYKAIKGYQNGHVYIFGHTYACEPCKKAMEEAGMTYEVVPNFDKSK